MKKKISFSDITLTVYVSLIHCSAITNDGEYISRKYSGYTTAQAKRLFYNFVNKL